METKLKFKVGDKVRVKSLKWYNENKNEVGRVLNEDASRFLLKEMSRFCGRTLQIKSIIEDDGYIMCENNFFWQDWMLEDEPVTEEKQEVEQSNKNDMKKEMTQEEVFAYLNNTKILCTSTEETAEVQEKLFELGIQWMYDGRNVREDKYLLFINSKGCISYCSDINTWMEDINKRIEPSEILAITLKEEKPKFDPKTLQPFDKVLVRQGKHSEWLARFFDFCEDDSYNTTSGSAWVMCIPYNEETKHLHGTAEEEPEFYKIWK